MRRLLLITFVLTAIMTLLLIAVRSIGSHYESPFVTAWKAYQCDPQPCWHGIRVGVTTYEQAHARLKNDPTIRFTGEESTQQFEFSIQSPPVVGSYDIAPDEQPSSPMADLALSFNDKSVDLGDLITYLGTPLAAMLCKDSPNDTLNVYFQEGVWAGFELPNSQTRLIATLGAMQLTYETMRIYDLADFRWRGLVNRDAYHCPGPY